MEGPIYALEDIYNANLRNDKSQKTRDNKIDEFRNWLLHRRNNGYYGPTMDEIKNMENRQPFFDIIPKYFEYRFNITYNNPDSFNADLGAIKHWLLLNGIVTNNTIHYPWFKYFKAGVRNICILVLGKEIGLSKLAIFNPILERLVEEAQHTYVILALLLAQRFCLRAQHYLKTDSDADFLTLGQVKFRYDKNENVISMTIHNKRDKNHASSHEMHRTVYCCCKTDWSCLPCYAEPIVDSRRARGCAPSEPLILNHGKHMRYTWFNQRLKRLIRELGLNDKYYSTHSLRAGGTTELHIAGYNILDIRNFVWWKSLDSVLDYIRPNNPDMEHFVPDVDLYYKSRFQKSAMFADNDQTILAMLFKKKSR